MPMKKRGKTSSVSPPPSSDQPGTSKDAAEQPSCRNPPSEETSQVSSVPRAKKMSYSTELFSTWRHIRWYQIPLSSLRRPKARLFSFTFQSSLQEYQQLRKTKRLKVGRPFSMLPLPSFPLPATDCSQETSRKRPRAFSRQVRARLQKCRPSTCLLPKRYIFCSGTARQRREEEPSSSCCISSRKKRKQTDRGHSERQALASDPCGVSRLPLPDCTIGGTVGSGDSTNMWANGSSPSEDDDEEMFPSDWTPPRVEFLYDEDLPVLSPAPGSESNSRSSGEMPDITGGSVGPGFTAEASSTGDTLPYFKEPITMQQKNEFFLEVGKEEAIGPKHSTPSSSGAVNKELEGVSLVGQMEENNPKALDLTRSPLLSPIHQWAASSTVCARSVIATYSDESVEEPGNLALDSDREGDTEPGCPLPPFPRHSLMAPPRLSSRCSISASSDECSGDSGRLALGSDMEEDMDDSGLVPMKDLFQMSSMMNGSSVERNTFPSSRPECYLNSLDKLIEEEREHVREDEELERSLGQKLPLSSSLGSAEAAEANEDTFLEAHRLLLEQFSISQGTIPTVHPGESIFLPSPYRRSALVFNAAGLKPQNTLESLFFSFPFAQQMALLQNGFLGILYHSMPYCPHPVLHWLFQLMTLNIDVSSDAFGALWEIGIHQLASADEVNADVWCPKLKDITQAFYNLGACESTLYPAGLVPLEFRHTNLEPLEHPLGSVDMNDKSFCRDTPCQLTLAAILGNMFKFLTLCVVSLPHCYSDRQCLALLAPLCRLGLDRNLRKQPQMELQQLLLVLLESLQDWQGKLPELCHLLCHVSQHHHNLVAAIRLFPDTTARGRQLRRNLSLCFMRKLLGKTQIVPSPWQEETQLQQLGQLLPLMKPAYLKQDLQRLQEQPRKEQQELLAELDQEACYLCYSLLTLANVVVGTNTQPCREQGRLQELCAQLQWHISASIREDPYLIYRTELKDLAAQTYVKWQELLSRSLHRGTPQQPE